jgi:NAD-dependent deacetylase
MKKIVVLTGAGISAESGIKTFRDSDGLWENHDVMEVASIDGYRRNPELVLNFYNERRNVLDSVQPNEGHLALLRLEEKFDVCIITQNVDDLHERAGSKNILHLHGELRKMRSSEDPKMVFDCNQDIKLGDKCPLGSQLRPHIVWFGEDVPLINKAYSLVEEADFVLIIGTSMQVYPAAGLSDAAPSKAKIFYIDKNPAPVRSKKIEVIAEPASIGVPMVVERLISPIPTFPKR